MRVDVPAKPLFIHFLRGICKSEAFLSIFIRICLHCRLRPVPLIPGLEYHWLPRSLTPLLHFSHKLPALDLRFSRRRENCIFPHFYTSLWRFAQRSLQHFCTSGHLYCLAVYFDKSGGRFQVQLNGAQETCPLSDEQWRSPELYDENNGKVQNRRRREIELNFSLSLSLAAPVQSIQNLLHYLLST